MALTAPYVGRSGTRELDEEVFAEPFHMPLVHETTRAELNARRGGNASTLTRAEVAMTGAKAWRQKGTGRARAGALSTPQRYGGGVAFGPKPRRYTVKVNRKARRRALRCALSVHAARGTLSILDPSDFETPSTKRAAEAAGGPEAHSTLLVLGAGAEEEGAGRSFRNLPSVTVRRVDAVGVADIIGARRLVVSEPALERLGELAAPTVSRGRALTGAGEGS
jgi:large subunit ribosomal protein L4